MPAGRAQYRFRNSLTAQLRWFDELSAPAPHLLRSLKAEGTITIGAVTRALNQRKIPTARGAQWHVSSVANLLARASKLEAVH